MKHKRIVYESILFIPSLYLCTIHGPFQWMPSTKSSLSSSLQEYSFPSFFITTSRFPRENEVSLFLPALIRFVSFLSSRISLFEEQNNREKDPILLKIQSISLDLGTINLKMSPFFLSQTQTVLFVSCFFLCFLCLSVSYSFNKKANVCSNSSPWTS